MSAKINSNVEQSLAAKASTLMSLTILKSAATAGKASGKDTQRTGRAIKGMKKGSR